MIFGSDYLTVLNPDFVTDLVKEYLLYAPTEPVQQGQALPPGEKTPHTLSLYCMYYVYKIFLLALKQVLLILETVTRACPGLRVALFLVS